MWQILPLEKAQNTTIFDAPTVFGLAKAETTQIIVHGSYHDGISELGNHYTLKRWKKGTNISAGFMVFNVTNCGISGGIKANSRLLSKLGREMLKETYRRRQG